MSCLSWHWSAEDSEKEEVMSRKVISDISRSELEKLIDEWCLNKKYRDILKLRFLDHYTYEAIAEIVDMSDRQIKRIVYKYGDAVLSHIPSL